jgi:hypothetical protein
MAPATELNNLYRLRRNIPELLSELSLLTLKILMSKSTPMKIKSRQWAISQAELGESRFSQNTRV